MEVKIKNIVVHRYSEALKHLICKEHIDNGTPLNELKRKYQLSSHSLIHDWLRKYKYLPDKYRFERNIIEISVENFSKTNSSIIHPLEAQKDSQKEDNLELTRLKKELEDAQIQLEGYKRMIEIAENELKIPIRKKYNTK